MKPAIPLALLAVATLANPPAFAQGAPGAAALDMSLIGQYLITGTGRGGNGDAINVQKTELGADSIFVANNDPNLASVFAGRWSSVTNTTTFGGNLMSAPVFEGIDYTGQMAITSPTGKFTLSDTRVYATDFAARCASPAGTGSGQCRNNLSSPSNSDWYTPLGNQGSLGNGAGVVGNYDHGPLVSSLIGARSFIAGLSAESTISTNFENGRSALDIDALDSNGDGFAVIDITRGGSDFLLNNHDWILNGGGEVTAIFRVRGNSNMLMSNSSISVGAGGIGADAPGSAASKLGAIFVHYEEPSGNSDAVFNFSNVILNGIGIWDLNAFRNGSYSDSVKTELNIQNGQGCAHFIGSAVSFTSSVRWNSCGADISSPIPEPSTYAMLLAGGVVLGAVYRRRRRG